MYLLSNSSNWLLYPPLERNRKMDSPKQVIENWFYRWTYVHTPPAALRHGKQTHPKRQVHREGWPFRARSAEQRIHHAVSEGAFLWPFCVSGCTWMCTVCKKNVSCLCVTMVWECCCAIPYLESKNNNLSWPATRPCLATRSPMKTNIEGKKECEERPQTKMSASCRADKPELPKALSAHVSSIKEENRMK